MPAAKKAKALVVTAPLVVANVGTGSIQFSYGDVLPDGVSEKSIEHLKALGYVEEIDAPESDNK